MNYEVTSELINAIEPYISTDDLKISTENKDWKGRNYKSDFVMLVEQNQICSVW